MNNSEADALAIALVDERKADTIADRLREGLARFNDPKVGPRRSRPLVISLTDEHGQLVGGLVGRTYWNALHIELLWISEDHRHGGFGRRLVEAAEDEGRARGAEVVYLTTLSFQAPRLFEAR